MTGLSRAKLRTATGFQKSANQLAKLLIVVSQPIHAEPLISLTKTCLALYYNLNTHLIVLQIG